MNEIVKQRIAMMFNNTLRLICFTVLAAVFYKWWIVLISILFFDYTERKK